MNMPEPYKLSLKPIFKSKATLLRFFPVKSFIAGQCFEISFHFKNIGNVAFPGVHFSWVIKWPAWSGQGVIEGFEIPMLKKDESWDSEPYRTDALSEGYGLIFVRELPTVEGQQVQFYVGDKLLENIEDSIGPVNARRSEEIYAIWGLVISAIGLSIIALEKVISFLSWLFQHLGNC